MKKKGISNKFILLKTLIRPLKNLNKRDMKMIGRESKSIERRTYTFRCGIREGDMTFGVGSKHKAKSIQDSIEGNSWW